MAARLKKRKKKIQLLYHNMNIGLQLRALQQSSSTFSTHIYACVKVYIHVLIFQTTHTHTKILNDKTSIERDKVYIRSYMYVHI